MQKNLTDVFVKKQIDTMHGCGQFEIGIRDVRTSKMMNIEMDRDGVLKLISRLKRENAKGGDIYIRPSHKEHHPFVLLDGIGIGAVQQLQRDGLAPCMEVEASPMNYQVLIRLPERLDRASRKAVERILQKRYGADLRSVDGEHYMRLSGFTNRKLEYRLENGRCPFVKLSASQPSAVVSAEVWRDIKRRIEQHQGDEIANPLSKPSAKALPLRPAMPGAGP